MVQHVKEGEKIINQGNLDDFGRLLNSAWLIKKKLSNSISNSKLDNLYNYAIQKGAIGGKLLGAGGGGFFFILHKKRIQKKIYSR
jgi:D-glycero-alpha-D-manno-heptose-7-phosphate kinase